MRVRTCAVYLVGGGLIIEANIPVQELVNEGQRGEGAYFREDTVIHRGFGSTWGDIFYMATQNG